MDLDIAWVSYFLNNKPGLPDTQVTQAFENESIGTRHFDDLGEERLIWQYVWNQNFHKISGHLLSKYSNGYLRIFLFKLLSRAPQFIVYR